MLAEPRTLTKAELAELLFERVGLNKREAKDIVDTFFEEIRDALARGDSVKLSGFGNFQVRDKPPRPGATPRPAKPSRSPRAAWSRSTRVRNSRASSNRPRPRRQTPRSDTLCR